RVLRGPLGRAPAARGARAGDGRDGDALRPGRGGRGDDRLRLGRGPDPARVRAAPPPRPPGPPPAHPVSRPGRPSVAHATSAGKVMLAFSGRSLPARPLRAFTP